MNNNAEYLRVQNFKSMTILYFPRQKKASLGHSVLIGLALVYLARI